MRLVMAGESMTCPLRSCYHVAFVGNPNKGHILRICALVNEGYPFFLGGFESEPRFCRIHLFFCVLTSSKQVQTPLGRLSQQLDPSPRSRGSTQAGSESICSSPSIISEPFAKLSLHQRSLHLVSTVRKSYPCATHLQSNRSKE